MESIGTDEAKTNFSQLLERVARGERVTITEGGVPVAVIQPPENYGKRNVREAVAAMQQFGQSNSLGELTIRELIEEGRD